MIKKMTNKAYHAAEGLSKSMMDKINKSPAHFKYSQEHPEEPSEAMVLGSLLHTLVLEPKLLKKEYAVMPAIDKRTTAGKAAYAEFLELNANKTIITEEQLETVSKWAEAIKNHPRAKVLLKPRTGQNEVSIFWKDKLTGEICKARLDRIVDDYIIDIKTAASAQPDDFQRKAYDLGYHRQAYWFSEAYEQEFGKQPAGFLFITVEKTPPYNVVVYAATEFFIEVGGIDSRKLLNTYHECKRTNNWFGYDGANQVVQDLSLPNYVISKYMEEV